MRKVVLTALIFLFSCQAFAQDILFYVVNPENEGDPNSVKPYLAEFFDYLREATGVSVTGMYINSIADADLAFKDAPAQLAIVNPDFFDQNASRLKLTKILQTIPSYSGGPFERYYIMANLHADILTFMEQQTPVRIVASRHYDQVFLDQKIFPESGDIKKIIWQLEQTPNIQDSIKQITTDQPNMFVFLTGSEFSVVNGLRKKNPDYAKLKLVYTSPELPSSPLVTVGSVDPALVEKIKEALMNMSGTLKGDMILKKLRLKGFAGI